MLYNLRSDIIYYKSGSDFELEFNLCGCCRMRLLTDKPSNKKAFVHSLARAVSRSRVILIAGPIFGEENTIGIVAQALGTTTETVNNEDFNIASDDEIEIIKGSIPLVASDGSFGGCIIESGPQTMILLTDNKTLRKNIMSNLIHPYISELYAAELKNDQTAPAEVDNTTTDNAPVLEETEEDLAEEGSLVLPVPEPETDDTIIAEEIIVDTPETVEEIPTPKADITFDDLVSDTSEAVVQAPNPAVDIAFNDLISDTPDIDEATPPIKNDINESLIILEDELDEKHQFPEEYEKTFNNLFMDDIGDRVPAEDYLNRNSQPKGYQFLNDDGEVIEETEGVVENRTPRFHIATIIITAILLLSIIVLCYCIFAASTSEGIAPTEYIRSVWQTVFG